MDQQFELVKIERLVTSPLNQRKTFDEKKQKELTESVKEKGIIEPLIVRSKNGKLEIVCGSRRFKAAKESKLDEVPVIIREYSDKEVVEVLLIENLQREDVHALDEADGYRRMIEEMGYDVPGIAAKIGKSDSYVYQRLQLSRLIPEAKKAFTENKITPGHGILISRLQPKNQKEAIQHCLQYRGDDGVASVRELMRWITNNVHLDLNKAPFDKTEKELVKGVGTCIECPKRTGFTPALFSDIKQKDICTDPECFNGKKEAFLERKIKEEEKKQETEKGSEKGPEKGSEKGSGKTVKPMLRLSDDYNNYGPNKPTHPTLYSSQYRVLSKDEKPCEFAKAGIMVDGKEVGRKKIVCADQACKKHWSRGYKKEPMSPGEKERRKKELDKRKQEKEYRGRVIKGILEKVGEKFKKAELAFVCKEVYGRVYFDFKKILCARHLIEPKKERYSKDFDGPFEKYIDGLDETGLNRVLVETAVVPMAEAGGEDELIRAALVFGVDWKKMKNVEEKKPAAPKKPKLESSVKKKPVPAKAKTKKGK